MKFNNRRQSDCASRGVLRAYLDRAMDSATLVLVDQHLATCVRCQSVLDEVRANAGIAALYLADQTEAASLDARTSASWLSVQSRIRSPSGPRMPALAETSAAKTSSPVQRPAERMKSMLSQAFSLRQRLALAATALMILITGILAVPDGRALAIGFLNLFRVQRFAVITVDPTQPFNPLAHLERLGTVRLPQRAPQPSATSSIVEAASQAGIQVRQPAWLPPGIAESPRVHVIPAAEASFTIDRQKAETYLQSVGARNAVVPERLDGSRLVLRVPTAVVLHYGDDAPNPSRQSTSNEEPRERRSAPHVPLIVAQLASPTAAAEGNASLAELREFLLGVPGLPADTVAQLRAIDDWTATLPIPVPRDRALWREISLDGAPALLIADRNAAAGALVWQRDGVVTGIVGPLTEQQLLDVARSMK